MAHGLTKVFEPEDEGFLVEFDPSVVKRSMWFSIFTTVGEENIQIQVRWESFKRYYYIDILKEDGGRTRFFPRVGVEESLRNFNPRNVKAPDVIVTVVSKVSDDQREVTPATLGVDHALLFMVGVVT